MIGYDFSALQGLSSSDQVLIDRVQAFTREYFQNPKFDASHDMEHVLRVTKNAVEIFPYEQDVRAKVGLPPLDMLTVILGALLHDVGDKKYVDSTTDVPEAKAALMDLGVEVSDEFATRISDLVDGVSYSAEKKRGAAATAELIQNIPELAVVQDADRLDAIGAIGIGRCFTFGGARGREGGLGVAIEHFKEKLLKLEEMMKTKRGKTLAAERSRRIREFMSWWEDEGASKIAVDESS